MREEYDQLADKGLTKESMIVRDVYLAGPFFKPEQAGEISGVEADLVLAGFSFFSPRQECRYTRGDDVIVADRAFFLNRYHIHHCKFILACLSWPDAGTAWELGYGEALRTPRIGFTSDMQVGLNLMAVKTVHSLVPRRKLLEKLREIRVDIDRGRGVVPALEKVDMLEYWHGEMV